MTTDARKHALILEQKEKLFQNLGAGWVFMCQDETSPFKDSFLHRKNIFVLDLLC